MSKIRKMNEVIQSQIELTMESGFHSIELQYRDIRLDFFIKNGEIKLSKFSRGHHVREYPNHTIGHRPSRNNEPASDKGDGALFLSLLVIYCNNIFTNIPVWIGGVTEWWRIEGVCVIKNACIKTKRSDYAYEINNDIFLEWANLKLEQFLHKNQPNVSPNPPSNHPSNVSPNHQSNPLPNHPSNVSNSKNKKPMMRRGGSPQIKYKGRMRKLHIGPRNGKYVIEGGNKKYI